MLHILWIILKILLIILAVFLALLLFLILIILFCPIRYSVAAKEETDDLKNLDASGGVSWLFGAIGIKVRFTIKGGLEKAICLFGIPLQKYREFFSRGKNKKAGQKTEKKSISDHSSDDEDFLSTRDEEADTSGAGESSLENMCDEDIDWDEFFSNTPEDDMEEDEEGELFREEGKAPSKPPVRPINEKLTPSDKTQASGEDKPSGKAEASGEDKPSGKAGALDKDRPPSKAETSSDPEKESDTEKAKSTRLDLIKAKLIQIKDKLVSILQNLKNKLQKASEDKKEKSETREKTSDTHKTASPKEEKAKGSAKINLGRIIGSALAAVFNIIYKIYSIISRPLRGRFSAIKTKISGIIDKIKTIPEKADNIKYKITWWKNFAFEDETKEVIGKIKKEVIRILRHILPKKIRGSMTFDFENPKTTGMVLGLVSMTYPVHKNRVEIRPVFEQTNYFRGNIDMKGRIYLIVPLVSALKIVISRRFWRVVKKAKAGPPKNRKSAGKKAA